MTHDSPHPQSLLELNQVHKEIHEMFYQHQVALLKGNYVLAGVLLKEYEETILNHMKEEDEILIPLYRQRAGQLKGGDADIFTLEHKKIVEWLNRLKMRLTRLNSNGQDMKNVIALLDDEAQFKKYTENHSLREDRIFYPEMDRVVKEEEKKHILRLLTFTSGEKEPESHE